MQCLRNRRQATGSQDRRSPHMINVHTTQRRWASAPYVYSWHRRGRTSRRADDRFNFRTQIYHYLHHFATDVWIDGLLPRL